MNDLPSSRRQKDALAHAVCILAILVAVIIAFSDVAGSERGLFFRDHLLVFRPRLWFVFESLRAHQLPLGPNPADPAGVPYEILPTSTFVPSTLLFFLAPFDVAYDWFVMSHFFILAIGAYALAYRLGAGRIEALAASGVAFVGPVISFENLLMGGVAWAPFVLFAFLGVLRRPSMPRVALLAVFAAFQVQGIWPEMVLLDVVGAAAIWAFENPREKRARILGCLCAAALLAIGLAAVEVLPVIEGLPGTRRGRGFTYSEAREWALTLPQLVDFIAPSFWYPPESPVVQPSTIIGGLTPYFTSLYFGSFLFVGATALAFERRRRASLAVAAVVIFFVLVAMGTPLHRALFSLPLLNQARFPVKYMLIAGCAVAALVPAGLRGFERAPRVLLFVSALHVVLLGSLLAVVGSGEFHDFLGSVLERRPGVAALGLSAAEFPRIAIESMTPRVVHALVFACATCAASIVAAAQPRFRAATRTMVALLILADVVLAARFSIAGAPVEPSGPPPEIRAKIENRQERTFAISAGTALAVPHREGKTYFEEEISSTLARGNHLYRGVRTFGDFDADAASNHSSALALDLVHHATPAAARAILARSGVRWVVSPKPDPDLQNSVSFDIPNEPPEFLLEIPGVRPYAAAYVKWTSVDLEGMPLPPMVGMFSGSLQRDQAIITDVRAGLGTTSTVSACPEPRVAVLSEGPFPSLSPVELEVEGTCRSIAVLRETLHAGWRVSVDGVEGKILPVELGFMGAAVEQGKHRVRFEYSARAHRWAWVSIASVAIAIALIAAPLFARRRRT